MSTVTISLGGLPVEVNLPGAMAMASAQLAASAAQEYAQNAELSAIAAEGLVGPTYASTAAGLAATTDGQGFAVVDGSGVVTVYLNNAGVAVAQRTVGTTGYFSASEGSSRIGFLQSGTGAFARTVQDKLRDFVNPRDFGALGDDVASDTAAFAAAAATGKPVVITSGTYRVAGCLFNARVYFMGGKIRRTGGTLAFSGGIDAAPGDNIFLDAVGISQVDINNDLTPEGWVDWFGYDADAIETCHAIFHINRFGPRDYFLTRTLVLDQSYREVIGSRGSAEGAGGTRLVMIGAAAASQPLVQVGTLNTTAVLSCARRLNIRYINTIRAGDTYQPVVSGRREDAVPGWKIAGWYEGRMEHCFDYGSAIHYRVYGTIGCTLAHCGGVRPDPGASNGNPDYYTAFVVGGYSTSFGFIGANASITIEHCGTAGGTGLNAMGLFLFGYIGDTWITKFEDSQLPYGIYVDGRDAAGATITTLTAHQDVRIRECILDAHTFNCLTIRGINNGGHINVSDNYLALNGAGDAMLIQDCVGAIGVRSGDIITKSDAANYGIRIVTSKRVSVGREVLIKDARVGLRAESCGQLHLTPTIHRANTGGTNALELSGVGRSYVQPIIDADVAAFDYGVVTDAGVNYSEVNLSGVNYGCFTTVVVGRKLWHNGATWGGGGTFGTANIVSGVLN